MVINTLPKESNTENNIDFQEKYYIRKISICTYKMYPEHLKIDSLQSLYVKNRLKSIFLILMILICLIKKTTL